MLDYATRKALIKRSLFMDIEQEEAQNVRYALSKMIDLRYYRRSFK